MKDVELMDRIEKAHRQHQKEVVRMEDNSTELYRRYRPYNLKQVIGQPSAVATIKKFVKKREFPHAILFIGPSGCGKTTLARIVKEKLKCHDIDFFEVNAAKERGIDMVRNISDRIGLAPSAGSCRIWLIDECHALSPDAQSAFLKMLEDTPSHVYFLLATTDPQKLKPTLRNRCTEIKVSLLTSAALQQLVEYVCSKEGIELAENVTERLIEASEGSARQALVLLHKITGLKDEDEQLAAIESEDTKAQSIEICRALMNKRTTWKDMAAILKKIDENPERVRHGVLRYASAVLLNGAYNPRAYLILTAFSDNYFDNQKAGLIASCWEVIAQKQ